MIEITNLTKKYGEQIALNGISFSVKKGEILGFLGPNGAGKTTTMKLITSFLDADSGDINVGGLSVENNSLKTRQSIGYLPEMVPLYDEFLVYEYLNFVAEIRGIPKNSIHDRTKEAMNECGLWEVATKTIDELSKGYKQRVGLAQAIIHKPDYLILDEPTTGLDPNQIIEIRKLIQKIGKEKTVIFSTHILSEANAISDRIIIINKGKIVAKGTPDQLSNMNHEGPMYNITVKGEKDTMYNSFKKIPEISFVSITGKESTNIYTYELKSKVSTDIRESISRNVVEHNYCILEFSKKSISLEDTFRQLTK